MRLPFTDEMTITTHFDPEMAALADRHYSRRTVGARQFMPNGRKIVLRSFDGLVVFGWLWPEDDKTMDGCTGYRCTIFRNESSRLSSTLILEAERIAVRLWGPRQAWTYVDPKKVKSANPGYCFKQAGWANSRNCDGTIRTSRKGAHLLMKVLL